MRPVLYVGTLRARFGGGGPSLFGATAAISDASITPVATRLRTRVAKTGADAQSYAAALLANTAFRAWEAEVVAETGTIQPTDAA